MDGASEASRLYICGLGVYEAYLNGEKIGSEYLAPGYHSYDFHLQVQTYDVTGLLKEGENTLEVWLGDGWFRGRFGFGEGFRNIYGDKIYLIAELYHGKELAAATDSTWESHPSPIVKAVFTMVRPTMPGWRQSWKPVGRAYGKKFRRTVVPWR